jgi:hypothetical protein
MGMRTLNYCILALLIGIGLSCRKKSYPPEQDIQNEPLYFSNLTIDNTPVTLAAGVNGYYMFSSFHQDSNNVYGFIADLKQTSCVNCPNSLKIQINDYKVSAPNESVKIDSSLRAKNYPLNMGYPGSYYSVQFSSSSFTAASYFWDFGDGNTSEDPSPGHTYKKAGKYTVRLTTRNTNSCESTISNMEKIDVSPASCKTFISAAYSGTNITFSNVTTGGQAPYQYLWNFGDGAISTVSAPVHSYKYRGSYPVTLRVVDFLGDTAISHFNAKTANDPYSCTANYSKSGIDEIPTYLALSNIFITWVDANGEIYTSNNAKQPVDGFFEILSISDDQNNENSQPTKKLKVRFKCRVYNGSKSISIDDAHATVCVAYRP